MLHEVAAAIRAGAGSLAMVALACLPSAPVEPPSAIIAAAPEAPALLVSARPTEPDPTKRDALAWETRDAAARARARALGRPMIVYLRADWSAAALTLEREVWSDPDVVREAKGFVDLKLDLSPAEADAELLARFYAATAVPTTIVLDAHGARVATLVGRFDREELLAALRAAQDAR